MSTDSAVPLPAAAGHDLPSAGVTATDALEMVAPDDWHLHLRDGDQLASLLRIPLQCRRAIIMPNLKPPVTTTEAALEYRERILGSLPEGVAFEPLMTLYLTDQTTPEEIVKAKASGKVVACKLYPAGATTNSDSGVTDIKKIYPTLRQMAESGILLLVHGEVRGLLDCSFLSLALLVVLLSCGNS
jgi:dihydroorotase